MNSVVEVAPLSDLRNRQREIMAQVVKGPVILTERGRGAAVLISMEEWQAINEQLRASGEVQGIKDLYAEFDIEERALAEAGLSDYATILKKEDERS
jgi:prevent-host-death family protein